MARADPMIVGTRVSHPPCAQRSASARGEIAIGVLAVAAVLAALGANPTSAGNLALSPTQPQQGTTFVMKPAKSRLGRIAQSDTALLGRADATLVHVLVKLDYDPVASYDGDVPGFAATSPGKTGKKLAQNKAAVEAYTGYVTAYESKVLERVRLKVPAAKLRQSFRTVYGGVAMTLPANRIGDLLAIEGVVAVQQDSLEQPLPRAPQ
jgi:hypothetical protein